MGTAGLLTACTSSISEAAMERRQRVRPSLRRRQTRERRFGSGSYVVRKMRSFEMQGDEWPVATGTFHRTFVAGPNRTGG